MQMSPAMVNACSAISRAESVVALKRARAAASAYEPPEPIAASLVRAGKLVPVLKPFAPMAPGVFLYYPSRHQMMPKLRAFIDHVKSRSGAAGRTRGVTTR